RRRPLRRRRRRRDRLPGRRRGGGCGGTPRAPARGLPRCCVPPRDRRAPSAPPTTLPPAHAPPPPPPSRPPPLARPPPPPRGGLARRRLQLSVRSFGRPVLFVFLPFVALLGALAIWRRDLLAAWLGDRPAMRAGLLGALVATGVGTLANDSGALLLVIGAAYL